tara:strand:+ start:879 stop:1085 length:207 start_codon:yes stop_codon:yes gene_type:complete
MTDLRKLMDSAMQELAEEEKDPRNLTIKEIIRVERHYYYSAKGSSGRLREIRDIVNKHSAEMEKSDAD